MAGHMAGHMYDFLAFRICNRGSSNYSFKLLTSLMAASTQQQIKALRREVEELKKEVNLVRSLVTTKLQQAIQLSVVNYLEQEAKFEVSTEGQIKELIND